MINLRLEQYPNEYLSVEDIHQVIYCVEITVSHILVNKLRAQHEPSRKNNGNMPPWKIRFKKYSEYQLLTYLNVKKEIKIISKRAKINLSESSDYRTKLNFYLDKCKQMAEALRAGIQSYNERVKISGA